MIFGAETPEVLETKINNLDEQINDAEENVKTTKEEVRLFYLCLHRFTFNHSSTHTNLIEFLGLNIPLKRELLLRFPPQLSNITYWLMVIDSYLLQWCWWSCCYAVKYDPLESLPPPPLLPSSPYLPGFGHATVYFPQTFDKTIISSVSCFPVFFFNSHLIFLRIFNEEALKDYERFKKQEVRDLKEVLAAHIKTQIMICKLVCAWFTYNFYRLHVLFILDRPAFQCNNKIPKSGRYFSRP